MTTAAANLDWLYHAGGIALASLAGLLLLWSLFWNRARGRLRCPKCWYDLSAQVAPPNAPATSDSPPSSLRHSRGGVASSLAIICPECAKRITTPRQLRKTRRRWRIAILATLALLVCPVIAAYPHRGNLYFAGMMPTWVLLRLLPISQSPPQTNLKVISTLVTHGLQTDPTMGPSTNATFVAPLPWRQQIQAELLFNRLTAPGALTESQWRSIIDTCERHRWVHFLSHCMVVCGLPESLAREAVERAIAENGVSLSAFRYRGKWSVWPQVPALLGVSQSNILVIRPAYAPRSLDHFRTRLPGSDGQWFPCSMVTLDPQHIAPPPDPSAASLPFLVSLEDERGNVAWSTTLDAEVIGAEEHEPP